MLAFGAAGFLLACGILRSLINIHRAEVKRGPLVISSWARVVQVQRESTWVDAGAEYNALLTGHAGQLGLNAAALFEWPRFAFERAYAIDDGLAIVTDYRASQTRWRAVYTRLGSTRDIAGSPVPLRDIP